MTIQEQAAAVYNKAQAARKQYEAQGCDWAVTPIMKASLAEIEAHIQNCQDASREYGVNVDYEKIEFGKTREEIMAIGLHKQHQSAGRRGYKALKSKYGEDSAKRILDKYAKK